MSQPIVVQVNFYGVLREITGKKSVEIRLGSVFLENLLKILSADYGDSFKGLFFISENLNPQINIFVNHVVVSPEKIPEIELHHGDQIDLFAPASGG